MKTVETKLAIALVLFSAPSLTIASEQQGKESARAATKDAAPNGVEGTHSPESPPPPPKVVKAMAFFGSPWGVGTIRIRISSEGPADTDDLQPALIQGDDRRVFYAVSSMNQPPQQCWRTVDIYFLVRGGDPLSLKVSLGAAVLDLPVLKFHHDQNECNRLAAEWWRTFSQANAGPIPAELDPIADYFTQMLARRMKRDGKITRERTRTSGLEQHFERAVGTLFGFESVRLAMMMDDVPESPGLPQAAIHPLPTPLRITPVPIPPTANAASIESIAQAVPVECFYLRCGRISNYLWVRDLLLGWGGSLSEVVASKSVDSKLRSRYEQQLAFSPKRALDDGIDDIISDCALIGTDLEFEDGAGLGILLQSDRPKLLATLLAAQRVECAKMTGAKETFVGRLNANGWQLSTADNRVRSFFVSHGQYSLLTNCERLATRFLDTLNSGESLGQLQEFKYACSQIPKNRDIIASIYLSDHFFRNVTSPSHRIERTRRKAARRDLEHLVLARLVAEAEGMSDRSVNDLIRAGFLPPMFGQRSDGSQPVLRNDVPLDSLRGRAGAFLPIADVNVESATTREIEAYRDFTAAYLREWQRMDPVILAISRDESVVPNRERVVIDVRVAPYARQEYAFLSRYLAESHHKHPVVSGDLLSLSARLREGGRAYDVCFGIRDEAVPYDVQGDQVIREGHFRGMEFANHNSYAAVRPAGDRGLVLLRQFAENFKGHFGGKGRTDVGDKGHTEVKQSRVAAAYIYRCLVEMARSRPVTAFLFDAASEKVKQFMSIEDRHLVDGRWTAYSRSSDLRNQVFNNLVVKSRPRPAQVVLTVGDVRSSQAFPYLRAYRYVQCKQDSDATVRMANEVSAWLNVSAEQARSSLEDALGGQLVCAAGGELKSVVKHGTRRLTSAMANHSPNGLTREVPEDYRFNFLEWLRGLEIEFSLTPTTLGARVQLDVHTDEHHEELFLLNKVKVALHRPVQKHDPNERGAGFQETTSKANARGRQALRGSRRRGQSSPPPVRPAGS